ncbi:MAG: right-handed parallel beta-helix repeat-containing protein [Planctomycetota bacterium]|nr:right-handed parallel beta-helix repeat-containing protein [Planctomycetota bacterium]
MPRTRFLSSRSCRRAALRVCAGAAAVCLGAGGANASGNGGWTSSEASPEMEVVTLDRDNVTITRNSRVVVPPGMVIADTDGNGVLLVSGSDITVRFEGTLRGATDDAAPDGLAGVGVRVTGKNVTLNAPRVSGFKIGIFATGADGLTVASADLSGNFRQRLRSTPVAEDASDWLWPHRNDANEWLTNYGAACYIEDSERVTIHDVLVRRGQNGLVLDRVNNSKIYDNDFSFLSGWGIAMWRSSDNVISRNAMDFCVRGYSHGVYNRGQDSAGLLMFEQCSRNVVAENSMTHGGDGVFAFAGREAIGEVAKEQNPGGVDEQLFKRLGCNDNVFFGNDLSFAVAHGLELTFSFGNVVVQNQLAHNAICGIWGGYSQDSIIANNRFTRNGEAGYGLERGAINMEHASGNRIVQNTFTDNAAGVHLWWDDDKGLLQLPGVRVNHRGVVENVIASNEFTGPGTHLHVRDLSALAGGVAATDESAKVRENTMLANRLSGGSVLFEPEGVKPREADPSGSEREAVAAVIEQTQARVDVLRKGLPGSRRPVGARSELAGREKIIVGEWGPWDHASLMVRRRTDSGGSLVYEVFGADPEASAVCDPFELPFQFMPAPRADRPAVMTITPPPGIWPYRIVFGVAGQAHMITGVAVGAAWSVTTFPWTIDPREDLDGWRREAGGPRAFSASVAAISMPFGNNGPRSLPFARGMLEEHAVSDRFGVIAQTRLRLPAGKWRFSTLSDDGVRLLVGDKVVLENWTHHGPTRDTGTLTLEQEQELDVLLEYFEIDGYATLELTVEPD